MDIDNYLGLMVKHSASDLFFSAGAPVNIKIEGETRPVGDKELTGTDVRQLAYSVMNDDQIASYEAKLELNMAISYAKLGRFRVNVYRQRGECAMVVRFIRSEIPSIESLGLPLVLQDLIMEKQGLVLVVGSTGSGKSTTLAAMINYRNERKRGHILTIEDPIEFVHEHKKSIVDQREVGLDTFSYTEALKNALREAPDVIVIGEIRDRETMRHAIHFSETGHICLATLHANNANQTLERIINFFPDTAHQGVYMDLAQHLRAIVSQRLVRTVDGKHAPAVEVLLRSPFVAELVEKGRINELKAAMEQAQIDGMQTFDQSLYELVRSGRVEMEEALRNADSRNNLRLRFSLEDSGALDTDKDLKIEGDPEELKVKFGKREP